MIKILLELSSDCDRVPGKINVTCQIKTKAFTNSQTGKITDHEWQIIICAAEMTLDVFPFLTNTNMLNTHLSSVDPQEPWAVLVREHGLDLQILAWVDCIF